MKFLLNNKTAYKTHDLVDNADRKINRKIRKDEKGLYCLNRNRKGYIIKIVTRRELNNGIIWISTVRKIDIYLEK